MFTFITQQVIAIITVPVLFFATIAVSEIASPLRSALQNLLFGRLLIAVVYAAGFGIGYWIPRLQKHGTRLARWAWLLPVIAFAFAFGSEWQLFGVNHAINAFFEPEAHTEEGLGYALFTVPTASAIAYSLGAVLAFSRSGRRARLNAREVAS